MEKHRHFILHKPYGYISQFKDDKRKKKKTLGELYDFPENTMSIGRLDEATEGLLLLTTDGMMSHKVRSKKVEKEYYVQVDGIATLKQIEQLCNGVEIGVQGEKYTTLPGKAGHILIPNFLPRTQKIRDERHGPTSWISITIREGKFRQVRKMTAAVGLPTLRLFRVRIANVYLKNKMAGEVEEVKDFDLG